MEGKKFQNLQNIAIFIADTPFLLKKMIERKSFNIDKPPILIKYKNKNRIEHFIHNKRNALLVLPRYDTYLERSVVEIIDLNNFEIIHTYKHDIDAMNKKVKNTKKFPNISKDDSLIRFEYWHPLILEDGSLVSDSNDSPLFRIDLCSNLLWINDKETFHHSKMIDHENNIWVPGKKDPYSKYVKQYHHTNKFNDDSIIKVNYDGEILINKSVIEILAENKIVDKNIMYYGLDPIHLNDIEPALTDGKYWKKGDLFLSIRNQSSIIHYRPSTNKVINYIKGPFSQQHDVDIISQKEISIFNNNNFIIDNEHSEVVIYNFETKIFSKLFNKQLKNEDFKTRLQGLSHILQDGSLMIEEQRHGRIILFNNKGQKEWEFINKSQNGDIGQINWSRVIEDKIFIEKIKSIIKNKECSNF